VRKQLVERNRASWLAESVLLLALLAPASAGAQVTTEEMVKGNERGRALLDKAVSLSCSFGKGWSQSKPGGKAKESFPVVASTVTFDSLNRETSSARRISSLPMPTTGDVLFLVRDNFHFIDFNGMTTVFAWPSPEHPGKFLAVHSWHAGYAGEFNGGQYLGWCQVSEYRGGLPPEVPAP